MNYPGLPLLIAMFVAGCAGTQTPRDRDTAPYNAVVVFHWPEGGSEDRPAEGEFRPTGEENAAKEEKEAASLSREWIENEILIGLEQYGVFSDVVLADVETMYAAAQLEHADLILLICIRSLAEWEAREIRVVPELALLSGVLWFGTAIGGLWVPDQEFPTRSNVEIAWTRPPTLKESSERAVDAVDLQNEFRYRERLSSGEYRLSMWERAKPWSYPLAYLADLLLPPALVPLRDEEEVSQSLVAAALADIKRELAQKLRGDILGSARAPFRFRLEEPKNGSPVDDRSIKLVYRYRVEPGFKEHETTRLASLRIDLKREDRADYQNVKKYEGDAIRDINESISEDTPIEEPITIGPGRNLIRFSAEAEFGRQWITNTIALNAP